MDEVRTSQDCAERILGLFLTHGRSAGEFLSGRTLEVPFSNDGWERSDFERGRQHASEQGWVTIPNDNCLGLTAAGQTEVRTLSRADPASSPR